MKAAVYKGARRFAVEEVPTPVPDKGQILVKITHSAICGTDVHAFMYDIMPVGHVPGHEYCGVVAKVGPGVTRWKVGDRVVGGGGAPPGSQDRLQMGPRFNYRTSGFARKPLRAYAEYIVMEEWEPLPIPQGVTEEQASLCEPCSVAVHAVRVSRLRLGDTAAVIGAGPIGLFTLQVARAAGARAVFVSEPAPARAAAARKLGAAEVIDPTKEDVVARMVELTDGLGPHVVFEAAGIKNTTDQALDMVRRYGQVVLIAVPWEYIPIRPVDWMAREVELKTTFGSTTEDWHISLDLMKQGKVDVGPMLAPDSFIPLERIQEAFEALMKPTTQLQMVVKF